MKLNHITFRVKNLDNSIAFYQDIVGMKIEKSLEEGPARLVYMKDSKTETMVELLEIKGEESFSGKGFFLCFACDKLEETHKLVMDKGLNPSPIQDPKDGTRYFYVYDPDQVSIQFRDFNTK